MKEQREILDENLEVDLRAQFLRIIKEHNLSVYMISKESGVARVTIDRIIEGKHDTSIRKTWVKLGAWRIKKGY